MAIRRYDASSQVEERELSRGGHRLLYPPVEKIRVVEVDNFPTVLIAHGDRVLFFGTITPHAGTLVRLVREALHGHMNALDDPVLAGLAQRVRAL